MILFWKLKYTFFNKSTTVIVLLIENINSLYLYIIELWYSVLMLIVSSRLTISWLGVLENGRKLGFTYPMLAKNLAGTTRQDSLVVSGTSFEFSDLQD